MCSTNIISIAWSPVAGCDCREALIDAFNGLGGQVLASDGLERRGLPDEVWHFLLATDWAVVRDTVIATALASGVPVGIDALRRGAQLLSLRFKTVAKTMPERDMGVVIIRDTRSGLEFTIPARLSENDAVWISLLAESLPAGSNSVWTGDGRGWVETRR